VVIRFKLEDLTPQLYQDFICNSQQIIDQVEGPGEFEYECFNITVYDKVDRASDNIIVTNPEIKLELLYTIH